MKYAVAQNHWYEQDKLPEGWSSDCIAISGGRIGWSDSMSLDKALRLTPDQVMGAAKRRIPDPQQYAGKIVHLDMENPIDASRVDAISDDGCRKLARAIAIRFEVASEFFPNSTTILADWAGRSWQDRPNVQDNKRLITMGRLAALGAYDPADGVAMTIYPPSAPGEKTWHRLEDVVKNNLNAGKAVFGEDAMILPLFSWIDGAVDEMAEVGVKVAGRCGFWSPRPRYDLMTGVAA